MGRVILEGRNLALHEKNGREHFTAWSFDLEIGQGGAIMENRTQKALPWLLIVSSLARPTTGSIAWFGRGHGDLSSSDLLRLRRKIGWVPRKGRLISNMTVEENLILGHAYHHELSRRESRDEASRLAEGFGLTEVLEVRPVELSPEKQRMAVFVRELIKSPELFVLENPEADFNPGDLVLVMNEVMARTEKLEAGFIVSIEPLSDLKQKVNWIFSLGEPDHLGPAVPDALGTTTPTDGGEPAC
ncbi:MAG: ATP-binding cassette domain-containing protein [Pseudomonadota bacterium]